MSISNLAIQIATKYYEADNCNRPIEAAGITFVFPQYGVIAGSCRGTYVAEKFEEQVALASLASIKKNAIWEITPEQYEQKRGIKLAAQPMRWQTNDSSTPPREQTAKPAQERIKDKVDRTLHPQPVAEPEPAAVEVKPLNTPDEALRVGKTEVEVSPPPHQESKVSKKKK